LYVINLEINIFSLIIFLIFIIKVINFCINLINLCNFQIFFINLFLILNITKKIIMKKLIINFFKLKIHFQNIKCLFILKKLNNLELFQNRYFRKFLKI
jgi:hypothetical protein